MTKRAANAIYARVTADGEQWATPHGFPEHVKVSTLGRVLLEERTTVRSDGVARHWPAKMLSLRPDRDGYLVVSLRLGGKNKCLKVHRLVLMAHDPRPDAASVDVNHLNGVKPDNRRCNLEWCSKSENQLHSYRELGRKSALIGRPAHNRGSFNSARSSRSVVGTPISGGRPIAFPSLAEAARNGYFVGRCLSGKAKTCKGFTWAYAESR